MCTLNNIIHMQCLTKHKSLTSYYSQTRILVTHSLQYLKDMDQAIFMKDGEMVCHGGYDELLRHNAEFAEYVQKDVISDLTVRSQLLSSKNNNPTQQNG